MRKKFIEVPSHFVLKLLSMNCSSPISFLLLFQISINFFQSSSFENNNMYTSMQSSLMTKKYGALSVSLGPFLHFEVFFFAQKVKLSDFTCDTKSRQNQFYTANLSKLKLQCK
jgi:hypothetical protein